MVKLQLYWQRFKFGLSTVPILHFVQIVSPIHSSQNEVKLKEQRMQAARLISLKYPIRN